LSARKRNAFRAFLFDLTGTHTLLRKITDPGKNRLTK